MLLLEDLLGEHREVDAPVAPDMTAIGLNIFIGITLRIPIGTQIDGALIEEVGLAHTHPVELGLATEETGTLCLELGTSLDLLGKRSLVITS